MWMPIDWKVIVVLGLALGFGHIKVIAHQKGIGFLGGDPRRKGLLDASMIAKGMGDSVAGNSLYGHEACGSRFDIHACR